MFWLMCRGFIGVGGVKCGCGKVKWGLQEGGVRGGGKSESLQQLAVALSVSLCGFIVPLLCRLYK